MDSNEPRKDIMAGGYSMDSNGPRATTSTTTTTTTTTTSIENLVQQTHLHSSQMIEVSQITLLTKEKTGVHNYMHIKLVQYYTSLWSFPIL